MTERGERILIVDDEAGIRSTLSGILEDEGYGVAAVGTAAEATARLGAEAFDAVLLDLWLPDRDGMELLSEVRDQPVIVISGHATVDTAVKATRLGAYDFLEKPLSLSRVVVTVQNALERGRLARELRQLSDRLARAEPLLGGSPPMQRLKAELATAARSESRILILGENGTGKELVARQVHRLSGRSQGPFVEVNCAAIPEDLIESELFGHVRGAFTGAVGDRPGRFEQADGGTLFLDEIADMSLKTQARVLRVLQEQRFERVGGSAPIRVDVRVLAATNKDLEEEIRQGRFREDLYFRLAVIPLRVPPLRERAEDVPILVAHFVALFAHETKQRPKAIDGDALRRLREYSWPGNVRELRNLVERMMIMVPGPTIGVADLSAAVRNAGDGSGGPARGDEAAGGGRAPWDADYPSLREARDAFEKYFIERQLAALDGNVSRTAQLLGLERSNLYRKMRAYGIEVERHGAAGAADSPDPADSAGRADPANSSTPATPATPATTAAPIIEP
ncbi:MAG TPA: sigma-54 dependent transcriptional regulator [Thermoanaerobaculia bacterium]|jgi:two-component system nitrogen regulation response regulator NtrX|nr:sigma-54 dependent transcriptional regulator [Thermoanaerobaculia bacterium]